MWRAGSRIRGREGLIASRAVVATALAALAVVGYKLHDDFRFPWVPAPAQTCVMDKEWVNSKVLDVQVFASGLKPDQKLKAVAVTWGDGVKSEINTEGAPTIGTEHQYLRWIGGAAVTAHTIVIEHLAGGQERVVTEPTDAACEYALPATPPQAPGG